jgi:hypothetical protein
MTTFSFTTFDTALQAKLNSASVNLSAQDYLLLAKAVQTALDTTNGISLLDLKGTANGVAGLDASGQVSLSQLLNAIPTQSSNSGKFLTTNGAETSWATVDAFPSQATNAGKVLTTDGASASWTNTLALSTISTTGILTAGTQLFAGAGASAYNTSAALTSPVAVFNVASSADSYGQLALYNSTATSSTDIIAYSANGVDASGWIDMGITGEDFFQEEFGITGPNDGYIFMQAPEKFTETVTNKELTNNVATLTIGANDFRVGMPVTVTGVDATFNGTYTITARTSTTFSYAKTASNVTSTAASGTAVAGKTGEGNLVLATGANGTANKIIFAAGGLTSGNEQMSITPDENVHIEIDTPSTSASTGALTVVGGIGVQGDMNVQGNVAIQGTITFGGEGTTVSAANLSVTDPLVFVGKDNPADLLDLGVVTEYTTSVSTITRTVSNKALTSNVATITTSETHGFAVGDYVVVSDVDATFNGTYLVASVPTTTTLTFAKEAANVTSTVATGSAVVSSRRRFGGIVRDASDGTTKLFEDATTKPTSTINFAEDGLVYGDLQVGPLTASSLTVGDVSNTEFGYLNGVTSAIQTQLNNKLETSAASATYAPLLQTVTTPSFTANAYTLQASDKDKVILASNGATSATLTIPTGTFETGTVLTIVQTGAGQITIASSGTLNSNGSKFKLNGQFASAQIIVTAINTFLLIGNLAA